MNKITIENNEQFLRQISKPIIFPDNDLINDIKILEEYFNNGNKTLALAAVQLGIPKRLIYLRNTNLDIINRQNNNEEKEEDRNYNEARILINPIIISREGLTEYWECCASCLDNMGLVERPYKIVVEYQDINGNKQEETFEGFESTVLSHEMDHLDGILHIDKSKEIIVMEPEKRKIFRKTHGYNIISKTGNYEKHINKIKKLS